MRTTIGGLVDEGRRVTCYDDDGTEREDDPVVVENTIVRTGRLCKLMTVGEASVRRWT